MNQSFKISILLITLIFLINSQICPQTVNSQNQLITLAPECFRKVYNSQIHDGHKLSRILNERISNYKKILQNIKMNDIDHLKTHPVIKWAQSQSQIFLNIRLSHRHDSPTCSDIRFQEIQTNVDQSFGDITIKKFHKQSQINYSTLKFLSQCYFTHQKLLFNLQIDFSSLITTLQVKKQGFGRFTIIGQKQRPQIWIHPFTGYKNAGIWSQMRNKYSADMDKYFQFIQQSKDSSKNNKPNKKYRNKKSTHQSQKIQQIQKTQL